MRELGQLSLKLLAFSLVAGLLLALTNAITEEPIAQQQAQKANASRYAVMSGADTFEEVEIDGAYIQVAPSLTAIYRAYSGNKPVGYTMNLAPAGYKAEIDLTVGISDDGAITGVTVDSQSETQGVGSKITGKDFLRQFTGEAASADDIESDIDTITGATVSSKTVKNAVKTAAVLSETVLGIEPHFATPLAAEDEYRVNTLPGASGFDTLELVSFLGNYNMISGIKTAYSGSNIIGYSFDISISIGNLDRTLTMGISNAQGAITGLGAADESDMTSEESAYYAQFAGLTLSDDALDGIKAMESDANLSSEMLRGVKQAVAFYNQYLAGGTAQDNTKSDAVSINNADALIDISDRMAGSEAAYALIEKVEQAESNGEVIGYRFTVTINDIASALTVDVVNGRMYTFLYAGNDSAAQEALNAMCGTLFLPDDIAAAIESVQLDDSIASGLVQCAAFYDAYISGEEAAA